MDSQEKYKYDKISVFFKHTDYYGFVHPYNYFEWTSYVRESFFSEKCSNFQEILNSPIKMMTTKISAVVNHESVFADRLIGLFSVHKIKKFSFDVNIDFFNTRTNSVACTTKHTLVFLNSKTQEFDEIPKLLKMAISQYA